MDRSEVHEEGSGADLDIELGIEGPPEQQGNPGSKMTKQSYAPSTIAMLTDDPAQVGHFFHNQG